MKVICSTLVLLLAAANVNARLGKPEARLLDSIAQVRLVGGNAPSEGRVEIRNPATGAWGTVCDDHWTMNDAHVVCRQLGYADGASEAPHLARFGQGTGDILLDDVSCQGNELGLSRCNYRGKSNGMGSHNCRHHEDASVVCTGILLGAAAVTVPALDGLCREAGVTHKPAGASCADTPAWFDADGPTYNCQWYAKGTRCSSYGHGYANKGQTANQACCACGGGQQAVGGAGAAGTCDYEACGKTTSSLVASIGEHVARVETCKDEIATTHSGLVAAQRVTEILDSFKEASESVHEATTKLKKIYARFISKAVKKIPKVGVVADQTAKTVLKVAEKVSKVLKKITKPFGVINKLATKAKDGVGVAKDGMDHFYEAASAAEGILAHLQECGASCATRELHEAADGLLAFFDAVDPAIVKCGDGIGDMNEWFEQRMKALEAALAPLKELVGFINEAANTLSAVMGTVEDIKCCLPEPFQFIIDVGGLPFRLMSCPISGLTAAATHATSGLFQEAFVKTLEGALGELLALLVEGLNLPTLDFELSTSYAFGVATSGSAAAGVTVSTTETTVTLPAEAEGCFAGLENARAELTLSVDLDLDLKQQAQDALAHHFGGREPFSLEQHMKEAERQLVAPCRAAREEIKQLAEGYLPCECNNPVVKAVVDHIPAVAVVNGITNGIKAAINDPRLAVMEGVKNYGQTCWDQCGHTTGRCNYCGLGSCCKANFGDNKLSCIGQGRPFHHRCGRVSVQASTLLRNAMRQYPALGRAHWLEKMPHLFMENGVPILPEHNEL